MKKVLAASVVAAVLSGGSAFAACEYNGVYYQPGTQLCFDGWLQECTVADYWKAIGMCKAPDAVAPVVDNTKADTQMLIAKALGTYRKPVPQASSIR